MAHRKSQTMSINEVADFLGKSWQFVNSAVKRGEIPAAKIGSNWFVSREYIESLIPTTVKKNEGSR